MLENARSPTKLPLGHLGTSDIGPEPENEPTSPRKTPSVSTIEDMVAIRPSPVQQQQQQQTQAQAQSRAPPILKPYDAVMPMNGTYGQQMPSSSQVKKMKKMKNK